MASEQDSLRSIWHADVRALSAQCGLIISNDKTSASNFYCAFGRNSVRQSNLDLTQQRRLERLSLCDTNFVCLKCGGRN